MRNLIERLLHSPKIGEVVRFGIVGVAATAIHYGIYLLLNLWINVNISYTIGYVTSFICNFLLSNYFTFKTKPTAKKGAGFAFSHAINWGMQLVLLNVFMWLGVCEIWAPLPTWCITIPVNFLLVRFFLKK